MRIEVVSKNDNKLFDRVDVSFLVKEVSATPSRVEIRKKLAAVISAKDDCVIVDKLVTQYGSTDVRGVARVYSSNAELRKNEAGFLVKRNFGEEVKEDNVKEEGGVSDSGAESGAKPEDSEA